MDQTGNPYECYEESSEGKVVRFYIDKKEPLRAEQEAFLSAVRNEKPVLVTGEDGLWALKLAHEMMTSGQQHKVIEFDYSMK